MEIITVLWPWPYIIAGLVFAVWIATALITDSKDVHAAGYRSRSEMDQAAQAEFVKNSDIFGEAFMRRLEIQRVH